MKLGSRIMALITSVCLTAGLSAAFSCENAEALNLENSFRPQSFDLSVKIRNDLNALDIPMLSSLYENSEYTQDLDFSDMSSFYEHYDLAEFTEIYQKAQALVENQADFSEIAEYLDAMAAEITYVEFLYCAALVTFDSDTSNSDYSDEMNYTYDTYTQMSIISYEFMKALVQNEFYYNDVVEIIGQETVDEYINSDVDVEQNAEYMQKSNELQMQYYTLLNSDAAESDFAELYLEITRLNNEYARSQNYNNYMETVYEQYLRDYTIDDAKALCNAIAENMPAVYLGVAEDMISDTNYQYLSSKSFTVDEMLGILDTYTQKMSPDINESYQCMKNTNAYSIACDTDDVARMNGAYTLTIPMYNIPYIFATVYDDVNDLRTIVHEFGHYNMFYHSESQGNSLDVDEIASQGLETLYLNYYGDIFGDEYEEIAVENQIFNCIGVFVQAAIISEFEMQAYENDDMTADELMALASSIGEKYFGDGNISWYYVSHIFETPGYYISYVTSMAAALELWNTSTYDFDKAVSDYIKIIETESNFGIVKTLSDAGMNNIFEADTIKGIADTINQKYLGVEIPTVEYDINQDGKVTSEDAYLILLCVVGKTELTDEQKAIADTNGDSDITSDDALPVLRKVVGL